LNPKLPKLFQTKPYRCRAGVEKEDPVPDLPLTTRATMGLRCDVSSKANKRSGGKVGRGVKELQADRQKAPRTTRGERDAKGSSPPWLHHIVSLPLPLPHRLSLSLIDEQIEQRHESAHVRRTTISWENWSTGAVLPAGVPIIPWVSFDMSMTLFI